ncbi:Uncharacterized protein TCM_042648 isoform 1 [Theobroma cacao]|uniref:Uncharacterized protein isoform 1 n=1 Tax=Theobroma cacao TaxID=3641 RepID=A0A061FMP5_THECC|nr:Uncharacterized protein TCM_042648 isoform 1 [Theobroma cacao]
MGAPMKYTCVVVFLVILSIAGFNGVDGYGPCGKHDIEKEAEKLAPCTKAAQYLEAPVSKRCCTVMEKKLKNPDCLCAIMFSHTARSAGVNPEVAVTIPKRCNIPVRPLSHWFKREDSHGSSSCTKLLGVSSISVRILSLLLVNPVDQFHCDIQPFK